MRNIFAFLDMYNAPKLGTLSEKRCFGAVTFLGRYGLMDFMLSNFSNSMIDNVGILVSEYATSARNHIRDASTFILNTRTGGMSVLYDEKGVLRPQFNNDLSDIINNQSNISFNGIKYFVFAPSNLVMNFDFRELVKYHEAHNADVTMVYTHRDDLKKSFPGWNILSLEDGLVKSLKKNASEVKSGDISLETYIFSRNAFFEMLENQPLISPKYGVREMVEYYVKKKKKDINAYNFEGVVYPIFNLGDYVEVSFALLSYENRKELFFDNWPIYTTTHNTPPAIYGPDAEVVNSFIANGSYINGHVENSIISRDVTIKKGAVIKDSILFTGTKVGEYIQIEYVLSDKNVRVVSTKRLRGTKKDMLVIRQGENI